ncbi:increased DNA methylation 1-like [Forsythia ovata]|uniref:Increased DNA methylation 1-like n=1 Tax=Forsythia ovata TaxID=205694 RepID=A0ABD1RJQ8_9LAMI
MLDASEIKVLKFWMTIPNKIGSATKHVNRYFNQLSFIEYGRHSEAEVFEALSIAIFWGLRNILGRAVPVGNENLTWTLMKNIKADSHDQEASDNEFLVESYSKLNIALSVMHECFEPVKEPHTKRDLMEDVIFSRWSELNRLNFQGFYTVLLERNDELISVATIRIYGKKVAEVPLVATRFQYRRLGMCRILMNELEKKLMELGVERLVLPAVPGVLNTWTTSFGFSIMKESERLNFLDHTFLDFQDTVVCQKVLSHIPSLVSRLSTETQDKTCAPMRKNDADLDGNSAVSAISQAERVEESVIKDQGSTCFIELLLISYLQVNQTTPLNCPSFGTGITVECPVGVPDNKQVEDSNRDGLIKCYKRRRISVC